MVCPAFALRKEICRPYDEPSIGPPWLQPLLNTTFFKPCSVHVEANKNECNQYCLNCRGPPLCTSCLVNHRGHEVIQIRRSSYHDVIRVLEIQKLLDLTGIQTYIINSARVVFINGRPQVRQGKGVTNNCEICNRSLLDTYRYCSLGCKMEGIHIHWDMTFIPSLKPCSGAMGAAITATITTPTSSNSGSEYLSEDQSSPHYPRKARTVRKSPHPPIPFLAEEEEEVKAGYTDHSDHHCGANVVPGSEEENKNSNHSDMSPPTPPPTFTPRRLKRRKGVPHRAPMTS